MKIVVPTRDGRVDDHFGHCDHYTVYVIGNERNILSKAALPSPQGCGCKSGIAAIFERMGVDTMLAGNMGQGALRVLTEHGIRVIRGCSGPTDALVEQFLAGEIEDSGSACDHHDCTSHKH